MYSAPMLRMPSGRLSQFSNRGFLGVRGPARPGGVPSPAMGVAGLGQEDYQRWYRRAKDAVAKYQALLRRAGNIAAQAVRSDITRWLGDASVSGTPAYSYNAVVSDLQQDVEGRPDPVTGGPNVLAYQVPRRRARIERLEDFNREFERRVVEAERFYGSLPPPQVITVPGAPAAGPDLTIPLVVGGGIAAALLLGIL